MLAGALHVLHWWEGDENNSYDLGLIWLRREAGYPRSAQYFVFEIRVTR
jgi:hypothetical protein